MIWSFGDWTEDTAALYDNFSGALVCKIHKTGGVDQQHIRLIRWAPEMLEAIRWIASQGYTTQSADIIDHARRVLAKAEGRSE